MFAESEGFEPPEAFTSTVFKTAALNHSANSPNSPTFFERDCKGNEKDEHCKTFSKNFKKTLGKLEENLKQTAISPIQPAKFEYQPKEHGKNYHIALISLIYLLLFKISRHIH